MKASDIVEAMQTLINTKGDVAINVQVTKDGEISYSEIEGVSYVQTPNGEVVILVPILE